MQHLLTRHCSSVQPVFHCQRPYLRPQTSRSSSLIVRADGDKKENPERTFASQFRDLTTEEINQEVVKSKKAIFELKLAMYTGKEFKSHMFKYNRRKIAQLLTVRRQKEIEKGINKRQSRKMEKKRLLELGEITI